MFGRATVELRLSAAYSLDAFVFGAGFRVYIKMDEIFSGSS